MLGALIVLWSHARSLHDMSQMAPYMDVSQWRDSVREPRLEHNHRFCVTFLRPPGVWESVVKVYKGKMILSC